MDAVVFVKMSEEMYNKPPKNSSENRKFGPQRTLVNHLDVPELTDLVWSTPEPELKHRARTKDKDRHTPLER